MLSLYLQQVEEGVKDPSPSLRDIMHWHLTANHYPRVDAMFSQPCLDAVNAVCNGHDPESTLIDLPNESMYEKFPQPVTAEALILAFNLEVFIDSLSTADQVECDDELIQIPAVSSKHEVNLMDNRTMTISLTDDGIIFDVYGRGDDDPFTRGMTYEEWADWVQVTDPRNSETLSHEERKDLRDD
jgi:hypothetical protein